MNNPLVSILVPVYGVENFIERCAVSLFEQTYDNIEYIFVDDCGPDNSIDILKKVIHRYPSREQNVHIIRHEHNKGLAGSRNTAVAHAQGEFLMHVDSDDYLDITAVEKCMLKQVENNADIVSFGCKVLWPAYIEIYLSPDFKSSKDMTLKLLGRETIIAIWARLIRTSLYKNHDIKVIEGYNMAEDYQVAPRLAYYANKVATIKDLLYIYDKRNETAITNSFSEKNEKMIYFAIDQLVSFFKDKGQEYLDAAYKAKASACARSLIYICKTGGHEDYYNKIRKEIGLLDKKYISTIPIFDRIAVFLSRCRPLATAYINSVSFIKHKIQERIEQ